MKVKKFHTIQIECHTQKEYDEIITFINIELDPNDCLCWYFEEQDLIIQIEYLEDETFEKISNFLKTL